MSPTPVAGALAGLKVVEAGSLIAGPFCGQLLGDLGADVVKVEAPGRGDPIRGWGRVLPDGHSLWWPVIGRNKRSITLDLRVEPGQDIMRRLVASADVVVENFRPGTLERWNLDPVDLRRSDPRLIVARVSGFGQTGPYASRAGYGAIGEAMGGLRAITGDPDRPPARAGISIGDSLAGMFAALGVLAALHHRDRTGEGQIVDSAIYEAVLAVLESVVPEYDRTGHVRGRSGGVLPGIAPSNAYATADGEHLLIAANQDNVFRRFADAAGHAGWAEDPRFATHDARGAHQVELDGVIEAWTLTLPALDIEARLVDAGVPCGRIFTPREMLDDPHYRARQAIIRHAHPILGDLAMQNVVPRLTSTPGTIRRPAPELGEHTDEVLAELGYSSEEVASGRAARLL